MFTYITLKNFKSFKDITLDLRSKGGVPKSTAFIYGENASGKTNLMQSILFLTQTFRTLFIQGERIKLDKSQMEDLLNKASELPDGGDGINKFLSSILFTLKDLVTRNISVGCSDPMTMELGFYLKETNGSYKLVFSDGAIVFEELRFLINERSLPMYTLDRDSAYLSQSVFIDTKYRAELMDSIQKYWGKHTFLSILFNDLVSKNTSYVLDKLNSNLIFFIGWLQNISIMTNEKLINPWMAAPSYNFMDNMDSGYIEALNLSKLRILEDALSSFFSSIYSDVKQVYYNIQSEGNRLKYQLVFKKQIEGQLVEIPFYLESTGTDKLLRIFPYLMRAISGQTVLIDELDSGMHDLLVCEIVDYMIEAMEENKNGQLIITTHNTQLMKNINGENVYILSIDANGYKEISCINDYNFRTQKTNSIQSKYLNGDYAGIPYVGYVDFSELGERVSDLLEEEEIYS